MAGGGDRALDLQPGVDAGLVQVLQDFAGAVGRVAVRGAGSLVVTGGRSIQQIPQQIGDRFGVCGVARRDRGRGDDFAVRVDAKWPL